MDESRNKETNGRTDGCLGDRLIDRLRDCMPTGGQTYEEADGNGMHRADGQNQRKTWHANAF